MVVGVMNGGSEIADWEDWRRGDNLVQNLIGKFYETQQWTDVVFHLSDGSQVRAHKLILAISSSVFEAMFYGPMSDHNAMEFKVEDVKASGFRRLVQFTYTSRCMSWKVDEPEEWWHILEAANKYLNTRLVEQVESKLREISKKEAGKGVILRHLNMANRCSFETNVKSVFLNSVIKNTSKLIQSEMWGNLDEGAIMNVYNQEFLAANEGELYVGAKSWCLRNCSTQGEALSMFLEKFASKIIPEYMSQRDFLLSVANDAFLSQVDVFRDWTIKIMVKNAEDNTIRGSYRPMRIVEFFFNAKQHKNPVNPIQFTTESAVIDFQEETTKYTACLTSVLDGKENFGLHLNLKTESSSKPVQGNKPLNFVKPGPKSAKLHLPNLPEMMSDEEVQKYARKSALLIAKMKDGSYRHEVMLNLDDASGGFTSRDMFKTSLLDIEYVQVLVAIDARPSFKVSVISHKQFVEYVGSSDVPSRDILEEAEFAREFEFRVDSHNMEAAEKEICRTLKLKDCQAWYVNDENKCRKRDILGMDTDLSSFLRYDAIYKMMEKIKEEVANAKGRQGYAGKGGDFADTFVTKLSEEQKKYKAPHFWIMLEKEFKDDRDKLVSSVCKYDSSTGKLNYCGTICLQMQEEVTLKPTAEFFSMILYNSDPNSKVYLRRFLNPLIVTKVSPSDDIEGMNNFDIFIIQEGAKTSDQVIIDYDKFIVQKINEIQINCRPKSEMDDRVFNLAADRTQGIRHLKHKIREYLEAQVDTPVTVWECMSSEATTSNPLKKKSFRKALDYPISDDDDRKIKDFFTNCQAGERSIYYHI